MAQLGGELVDSSASLAWNRRQKAVLSRHGQLLNERPAVVENMLDRYSTLARGSPDSVTARHLQGSRVAVTAPLGDEPPDALHTIAARSAASPSRAGSIASPLRKPPPAVFIPSEAEEEEEEEEEEEGEAPLATIIGDYQLGSTLGVHVPDELMPGEGGNLEYCWCRSVDNDEWTPIAGAESATYLVRAEDVGCWLFAEWRFVDFEGTVLGEGSTEGSETPVRLLEEDREDLKTALLQAEMRAEVTALGGAGSVHTPIVGPAALSLSTAGLRIASKLGAGWALPLRATQLRPAASGEPLEVEISAREGERSLRCRLDSTQACDLLMLGVSCFASLGRPPLHEGACKVWEGEEYGAYFGRLFGEVLLLHEGSTAPAAGAQPAEAMLLHGCHVAETAVRHAFNAHHSRAPRETSPLSPPPFHRLPRPANFGATTLS